MIYVVTYIYDSGRAETISDLRPRHRQFLTDLHASGGLIASGPWVGGPAGAYLLVAAGSEREALEMLDPDPFRAAGVIEERSVRSEEHTSELQSRFDLVCRLLLEKKKRSAQRAEHQR